MIKAFRKYLLSACILLLSGHGLLNAHASNHAAVFSSLKISSCIVESGFISIPDYSKHSSILVSSGSEKKNDDCSDLFLFDNDDDDELNCSKKHSCASHSSDFFFGQSPARIINTQKKGSIFSTDFSFASSCHYLLFQVFRI